MHQVRDIHRGSTNDRGRKADNRARRARCWVGREPFIG